MRGRLKGVLTGFAGGEKGIGRSDSMTLGSARARESLRQERTLGVYNTGRFATFCAQTECGTIWNGEVCFTVWRFMGGISDFLQLRGQRLQIIFFCLRFIWNFKTLGPDFARALGGEEGLRQGVKRVLLSYSSDNMGIAGLHVGAAHKLDEIFHVFIRHR
jgi:hypothetical protein